MIARINWVDSAGWRLASSCHLATPGDSAVVANALNQYTIALNETNTETFTYSGAGYIAGVSIYPTIADIVRLDFKASADGSAASIILPAPYDDIYLPDNETVDPSLITTLTATLLGRILTSTGQPVDTYVRGIRRKLNRKGG